MPYGTPSTPEGVKWQAEFTLPGQQNPVGILTVTEVGTLASESDKDALLQAAVDGLVGAGLTIRAASKISESRQQVTPTEQ